MAILQQAIDDWKALEFGEYQEKLFCGQVIHRAEVLCFFQSENFEMMCRYILPTPVKEIKKKLNIPKGRGDE